jgi:hypothetical protein
VVREIPPQQIAEKPNELLPLDLPERVVVFRQREETKRHVFRRITSADWEYYFSHCFSGARREAGATPGNFAGMDYAALQLYRRTILRVEGYEAGGGSGSEKINDCQETVSRKHRLIAAQVLMNVSERTESGETRVGSKYAPVYIDALWGEDRHGRNAQYLGLTHIFGNPTALHHRRYTGAKNRAHVAARIAAGTTVDYSAADVMAKLYDELIERVEGYSVGGRPLAGKSEIVGEMDLFHKCFAAAKLFERASEAGCSSGGR